jgi:nicotinate-nucleotide pyrophosphorylase (carboxylating)
MVKTYCFKKIKKLPSNDLKKIVKDALKEDIGKCDITTSFIVPPHLRVKAIIYSKEKGILCGLNIVKIVFSLYDKKVRFREKVKEGDIVNPNQEIIEIIGNAQNILKCERTALNFLQRLSGIATKTKFFVELVKDYNVKILDTRKTTPNLRILEKYAVSVGGGYNHRMSLDEAVLIKENHLKFVEDIVKVVEELKKKKLKVEVEVENLKEFEKVLDSKADVIMLDNFKIRDIKKAVELNKGKKKLEVSGNVNEKNIREIAKTGIDYISLGTLTHSVKIVDFSLEIVEIL